MAAVEFPGVACERLWCALRLTSQRWQFAVLLRLSNQCKHKPKPAAPAVALVPQVRPPPAAQWVPDCEAELCQMCEVGFTVTRWRHHCRNCGGVFCDLCSQGRVLLTGYPEKQRVCSLCKRMQGSPSSKASPGRTLLPFQR